jgi:hypothetical protein
MGWHEGSVLMRIYGAGFAAVFSLVTLMYAHAYKLRGELDLNPVEAMETLVEMRENAILAMVGIGSFAIAFRNPEWAGWFYMVLLPAMWIHGAVSGKRTRALAHQMGLE